MPPWSSLVADAMRHRCISGSAKPNTAPLHQDTHKAVLDLRKEDCLARSGPFASTTSPHDSESWESRRGLQSLVIRLVSAIRR